MTFIYQTVTNKQDFTVIFCNKWLLRKSADNAFFADFLQAVLGFWDFCIWGSLKRSGPVEPFGNTITETIICFVAVEALRRTLIVFLYLEWWGYVGRGINMRMGMAMLSLFPYYTFLYYRYFTSLPPGRLIRMRNTCSYKNSSTQSKQTMGSMFTVIKEHITHSNSHSWMCLIVFGQQWSFMLQRSMLCAFECQLLSWRIYCWILTL